MESVLKRAIQESLIFAARPYISRELPGWGRLYSRFGTYRQDWLWEGSRPRLIRDKIHGALLHLDITRWADRWTFFLGRWYDLPMQLFVLDVVRRGASVVDIGANRGMFAMIAQHAVGTDGKVICFEPNPSVAAILESELTRNGLTNVILHRAALGDAEEELTLYVPRANHGQASFGDPGYTDSYDVRVPVLVGDEALSGVEPQLIKIDVEGFEARVLRGLEKTLERCSPIVILEIVHEHLKRCGSSATQIVDLMQAHEYCGYRLQGMRRNWALAPLDISAPDIGDVVWLPYGSERLPLFSGHLLRLPRSRR